MSLFGKREIEAAAFEMYAAGPHGEPLTWTDRATRIVTDCHSMTAYRTMAPVALDAAVAALDRDALVHEAMSALGADLIASDERLHPSLRVEALYQRQANAIAVLKAVGLIDH